MKSLRGGPTAGITHAAHTCEYARTAHSFGLCKYAYFDQFSCQLDAAQGSHPKDNITHTRMGETNQVLNTF